MIAHFRKNLTFSISKHTSPVPNKLIPICLHFFSTWTENQLSVSPSILDILLHKHDFPPELASQIASKLTHVKNPEKVDSVLSFFKESGFSNTQLKRIVNYRPRFLSANLDDSIKPKIKIFRDLGFSSNDITRIISSNPPILYLSVENNIIPSLSVLKDLLGSNDEVAGVLRASPWFLTVNLENAVVPNVEFFKSFGIPMDRIQIILRCFPRCFLVKPEIMRKSAEKVEKLGLNRKSKMYLYGVRAIASMSVEGWQLKQKAFRNLGFSESDIFEMFRKAPLALCGSMEKIKKVKEVLLATGKFNMSSIINSPMSLATSVEKRYIPRLHILGILESRKLIKNWPALGAVCKLSDDKFFQKFISPYLDEISDVYIPKHSAKGKRGMKA